ncbi:hypothetical protein PL321_07100 [Caloramator sp. mosi_1]|uniref:hypothetical protein n=1 Tax=Caloramator sp. mosi_1 TaxID=3023090 RepID=UPI002360D3D0|nr:hypothetical protein [Caloramator sp. mosi_1]WDC85221.1 hypothetical protein PL321_07100 [Caloramator sp. mosi_1]
MGKYRAKRLYSNRYKNQSTLIYNKQNNKIDLVKTFVCYTGVKDKSTSKGIFTITERELWFYSNKYKQGGVYWIRFKEKCLFHLFPISSKIR